MHSGLETRQHVVSPNGKAPLSPALIAVSKPGQMHPVRPMTSFQDLRAQTYWLSLVLHLSMARVAFQTKIIEKHVRS